ncbi:MAG: 4-carboxy-4-hydroxy-2-oxoadipate aldolase/oxaloacetate decarboxylase [Deltaproteobacteria bacterium]|nr:MAG: 4-carboxy-4-hydroxy-2-oxoadipate aldolase/oxaloacetate decarboxylase [Deltaproteobacteria bacterium]
MAHVIKHILRPPNELVVQFKDFGAATVYEAAGRIGSVDPSIKPLGRNMRLLGAALTVRCHPKDNLMLHKALQIAQPGDIIVAATDGYPNAGYFGDLMATSAMARQIGGLAVDGCVRDSSEIIEMGFPVFCRGTCMRGAVKQTLGSVNHSILFGDVVVNPGDLVLGDEDGIVTIPQSKLEAVLEASRLRAKKEKEKAAALKQGVSSVEFNKLDQVFQNLGLVED